MNVALERLLAGKPKQLLYTKADPKYEYAIFVQVVASIQSSIE